MIQITDPRNCSGCTACLNICGHNAIEMCPDNLGFLYPVVDTNKCVDCGLCEKVCPFHPEYDKSELLESPNVYAGRLSDEKQLMESQSGGAFKALALSILNRGGVVYGAGFADNYNIRHLRIETIENLNELSGSKYVQSNLFDIFRSVKKDLQEGRAVLFSGTPCQTAGIHSYIPKKLRANLYLVDLVCHGVPSPYIWRDNVRHIENKVGDTLLEVRFRDKRRLGWKVHKESFLFANRGCFIENDYTFLFYRHNNLRESCYNCQFTNLKRPSDVTIGDFWGGDKVLPEFAADGKGLSILICNTEKGQQLVGWAKDYMTLYSTEVNYVMQPNLQHPTRRPSERTSFEKDYVARGYEYVLNKYGQRGWRYKTRRLVGKLIYRPLVWAGKIKRLMFAK